jgi:CubicO group peptidase (beta-lactamase class C family)
VFALREVASPGPPEHVFAFGAPGATMLPVSGDFDGDGADSVGTFDVATGEFRLRNALSSGAADLVFRFGPPGALPVVGDWDGDGVDTVGVYDPVTRRVFLRNTNSAGPEDVVVQAPRNAWPSLPIAGHFGPVPLQAPRGFAWQTSTPAAQGIDAGTLGLASQRARFLPFVTSFLVARNGRLVHEEYLHGADRDQLHNVKSVSKSLLMMMVLLAVQQQRIVPSATLEQLLPEYFDGGTAPQKRQITLSHLTNMRAGFAWDDATQLGEMFSSDDWVRFTIDRPMAAAPGAAFNYSTGVTHLTAAALARAVAPQRLDAWAEASLFGPAGVTAYRWDRELDGRPFGGAEMYFTSRDLLRLAQLNLDRGRLDGQQIIDQALVDATTPSLASGYAAYWWFKTVRGHPVFYGLGHGGQLMYHVRDLGLVAVVTAYPEVSYAESTQQQQQIMQFLDDYVIPAAE